MLGWQPRWSARRGRPCRWPASGPAGDPAAGGDPAGHAEKADSLSLAFLVLLETLSPEQRAAFLLREVFDYPLRPDRRDRGDQ